MEIEAKEPCLPNLSLKINRLESDWVGNISNPELEIYQRLCNLKAGMFKARHVKTSYHATSVLFCLKLFCHSCELAFSGKYIEVNLTGGCRHCGIFFPLSLKCVCSMGAYQNLFPMHGFTHVLYRGGKPSTHRWRTPLCRLVTLCLASCECVV